MASLLIAAGVLSYTTIKKTRAKRAEKRTRFSELERDNAARIAQLQTHTCFCQSSDWRGGGCEVHGFVPAAGEVGGPPPRYDVEVDNHNDDGVGVGVGVDEGQGQGRRDEAPAYHEDEDATTTGVGHGARETSYPDYRYRRGEEDGLLAAEKQGARAPGPMAGEEVRRINEERRKRMKAGGFTNWVLRRKGRGGNGNGNGDAAVVR